jgi:hypothetical protein
VTHVVPPVSLLNTYTMIAHFKGTDPLQSWRSSFEFFSTAVPVPGGALENACADYWKANLRTDCTLDDIEVRNWSRGDLPFSLEGALFDSSAFAGAGTKTNVIHYGAEGANAVGKEVACFIRIATSPGKEGKQFIRQLLDDGDIAAVPGSPWQFLVPGPPNVTNTKFQAIVSGTVGPHFSGDPRLVVVHFPLKEYLLAPTAPANQPFATLISSMTLIGPTVNKATRKNPR